MKKTLLILAASAFCAHTAFAEEQGIGQVVQEHGGKVLEQTQGAGAKNVEQACKDNPNSQACADAKNAATSHRSSLHEQRMESAQEKMQSQ